MAKIVRVIILFVCIGFAIFFGIGMVNSWSEYQVAVEEADKAQQELEDATRDLEEAEKRLKEVTS